MFVKVNVRWICCYTVDFKALRRWVQMHPFNAELVAAEQVPVSTCIRINSFCQMHSEHCHQWLADHFACIAQRYRQHCVSTACEVNDDDIEIFPQHYVKVKFHCRPGEIQNCCSLCKPTVNYYNSITAQSGWLNYYNYNNN